jgi:hypothetical protein
MRRWSSEMLVMMLATGDTMLVASKRPPSPTSNAAASTPRSAKMRNAIAVRASK